MEKEALHYDIINGHVIKCKLCPHNCIIKEGKIGLCKVRENRNGMLYTNNYSKITSIAVDPIEKKPLFHFYPGSLILSVGSFGCNFSCGFCQNYKIAQENPASKKVSPMDLLKLALEVKPVGSIGVAFTYNEPSIWFEYIFETAQLLKDKHIQTVLVTNGFIEEEPLKQLIPYIDAMNIDVKGFTQDFYNKKCRGKLDEVKRTVEYCSSKIHIELTTLIIPEENDSIEEIEELAMWVKSLDEKIPLHLSRYYPAYKYNQQPTSYKTMKALYETAKKHLPYTYLGNLQNIDNNTYCSNCHNLLINRTTYDIYICGLINNVCRYCGKQLRIVN